MLESLTLFFPLLGFIVASLCIHKVSVKIPQYATSFLLILSAIFSWIIFIKFINNIEPYEIHLFNWISSGNFTVDWSIKIDTLSSIMLIVVTNISAAIHFYSIGYMANDHSIPRFMGYISLFTFFMLALVTSSNLLQMFFGWEGVGLASYLLIGFWHHKDSANNAAIKAFIVNRIGDFGFFLGIVGIFFIFNTVNFDEIFSQVNNITNDKIEFLNLNISTLDTLCILLFIGAMGKSAQLGLHTWLPDAMEGPTPVSALIHAATMVTAGVFMLARMSPLYANAEIANYVVILIGSLTAIFAATIALTQNDIKKVIAYSTCSQLGYMFFAAGVGAYSASIFHLMTHAFFKALLFLCAGSVIHAMHNEQDMRKMGGLSKKLPMTTILMWVASLAIIGFPLMSGYYSKESILESSYYSGTSIGMFAYFVGIVTAALTAFYSWRLLFMAFHGESRASRSELDEVHESPMIMLAPLLFLAVGSIISGTIAVEYFVGYKSYEFWGDSIILIKDHAQHLPFIQTLFVKLSVAGGIVLAAIFYYYKTKLPETLANYSEPLYSISFNKWYFDELYNNIFVNNFFKIGIFFWKKGDEGTIDAYGPNGLSRLIKIFADACGRLQSGYLYHYAFVMLIGLVCFLSWYLYI